MRSGVGSMLLSRLKGNFSGISLAILLSLLGLLLVGCFTRTGGNKVEIFTEMHYSQSFRSQEPERLLPPEGSVPITGKGIAYTPEEAKALTNPLPSTGQVLELGAQLYGVNCSMCHGLQGDGGGAVGAFLVKWGYGSPPDLTTALTQNRTDGDIFSIITFTLFGRPGISPMPDFGRLLTEDERWALVHHLRSLAGR